MFSGPLDTGLTPVKIPCGPLDYCDFILYKKIPS